MPRFDYYLARHIEVDGGVEDTPGHGELALRLLDRLCDDNADRHAEAENTGIQALRMRTRFWLGCLRTVRHKNSSVKDYNFSGKHQVKHPCGRSPQTVKTVR